ncbi:MAG: Mpo1-like protein [Planctomycetota bacterium]
MAGWLEHWLSRHQHPASRLFHAVAIPMLPLAGYLVVVQLREGAWSLWWRPAGLVVLSYALQWVGHRIEGNDMGEVVLLKKLVGRPYVSIAPRRSSDCAIRAAGASPRTR